MERSLKFMRSDAITPGIGNARLSSLKSMLCRSVLGKSALVLTPFAHVTIDESPATLAKLLLIAHQKLSPNHCFTSQSPIGSHDENLSTYDSPLPIRAYTNLSHLPQLLDVSHHSVAERKPASVSVLQDVVELGGKRSQVLVSRTLGIRHQEQLSSADDP